jgi:flagellar hook-associated protein 2
MTSTINFSGLASGLDTSSMVTELVAAHSGQLTALQTKATNVSDASSTISSFSTTLSQLASAATALSTTAGFSSFSATSSDPGVTASATGAASAGSYSLNVTQLAQAQRTYSSTFASSSDPIGQSGDINLQVGSGTAVDVPVTSDESLTDIAAAISSSGAGVSASVLYDGTSYRLQVVGLSTGAASAITFNESGTSLGLSTPSNTYQAAQDAQMTVDGISITRPTNQVTGVIPGVTLALTNTTSAPANINVASDPSGVTTALQTFVSAYNAVVSAVHTATGYGSTAATNTLLADDPTMRAALDDVNSIVDEVVPGTSGQYNTLGSVGLQIQNDGTLSLDTDTLDAAITANPTAVERLFVTDSTTGATGAMQQLSNMINSFTQDQGSLITARITSLGNQSSEITTEETDEQDRLNAYQTQLQSQFAAMELVVEKYKNEAGALNSLTGNSSSSSSSGGSSSSSSSSSSG